MKSVETTDIEAPSATRAIPWLDTKSFMEASLPDEHLGCFGEMPSKAEIKYLSRRHSGKRITEYSWYACSQPNASANFGPRPEAADGPEREAIEISRAPHRASARQTPDLRG
jgi:hypothetical protein